MASYNLSDMYKDYLESAKNPVDYKTYKEVIYSHNRLMIDTLLEGGIYYFGFRLGGFGIKLCKRVFKFDENGRIKNLKPNFHETKKLRAQGDMETVVYHTDPFFFKWQWFGSSLEHQSVWNIEPTDGPRGIGRKISNHVKNNPNAKLHYMRDKDVIVEQE